MNRVSKQIPHRTNVECTLQNIRNCFQSKKQFEKETIPALTGHLLACYRKNGTGNASRMDQQPIE